MTKLEELEGKEAKQTINDYETIPFEDFVKKYNCSSANNCGNRTWKIIEKLKKKVGDKK